jgi:ribosomal protein S11
MIQRAFYSSMLVRPGTEMLTTKKVGAMALKNQPPPSQIVQCALDWQRTIGERAPAATKMPLSVYRTDPRSYFQQLAEKRSLTHQAVEEASQKLVAQNQSVRQWMREQRGSGNGSMLPHEHVEQLPRGIGVVNIHAGKNNTICALADSNWRVLTTVSGGVCGLRGALRGTPESGTRTASRIAQFALRQGIRDVYVTLNGYAHNEHFC